MSDDECVCTGTVTRSKKGKENICQTCGKRFPSMNLEGERAGTSHQMLMMLIMKMNHYMIYLR